MNVRQQSMGRYNGNVTCLDYNIFSTEYFDGTSQVRGTCLEYNSHNSVHFFLFFGQKPRVHANFSIEFLENLNCTRVTVYKFLLEKDIDL